MPNTVIKVLIYPPIIDKNSNISDNPLATSALFSVFILEGLTEIVLTCSLIAKDFPLTSNI